MAQDESPSLRPPTDEQRRIAVANFERARQAGAGGNFDYAIELLLTCCKIDPANLTYRQALRENQRAKYGNNMRGSRFASLSTSKSRAQLALARKSRDYPRLLEAAERILTANPWDTGTLMEMSRAFDALSQPEMAIQALRDARVRDPDDARVNRAMARMLEKNGNYTLAIKLWQLVQKADPKDLEASHKAKELAASETIQRGRYEQATAERDGTDSDGDTKEFTPAVPASAEPAEDRTRRDAEPLLARLEANPTDAQLYLQLATVYRRAAKADRARAVLQQGLGPTGNDHRLALEIMELDLEPFRKNLRIAESKVTRLKQAGPEHDEELTLDEAREQRNRLRREVNLREMDLFRLRSDRFPEDAAIRMELGLRLMRADRHDEAIVEFQQARRDARQQGRALMFLGMCFQNRSKWKLAERNFTDALQHLTENEEANRKEVLFQLASGNADNGDLAKAIEYGHELANLDYGYHKIGSLLDEWEEQLRQEQEIS